MLRCLLKKFITHFGTIDNIMSYSLDEEILHISGSLVPPHTGCIRWLSRHGVEDGSHPDRFDSISPLVFRVVYLQFGLFLTNSKS